MSIQKGSKKVHLCEPNPICKIAPLCRDARLSYTSISQVMLAPRFATCAKSSIIENTPPHKVAEQKLGG